RREVEGVRAADDPDRDGLLVLNECGDRRGDLRCVGSERGQEPEQRFRHPEPQARLVEAPGEDCGGAEHERAGDDEAGDGGCGRHESTPTRLPGTPVGTLIQKLRQVPWSDCSAALSLASSCSPSKAIVVGGGGSAADGPNGVPLPGRKTRARTQ